VADILDLVHGDICGPVAPTMSSATTPIATPASPKRVKFAMPPSNLHDALDADHDDNAPVRFRTLDNVLGPGTSPGLAAQDLDARELCFTTVEEPTSFKEAEKHQCWQRAMEEEMTSIEENKT